MEIFLFEQQKRKRKEISTNHKKMFGFFISCWDPMREDNHKKKKK